MAARPPGFDPPPEPSSFIDETAPPQRSPLRAPLPFAGGQAPSPQGASAQGASGQGSFVDETAPPQRSPLAAALPFGPPLNTIASLSVHSPATSHAPPPAGGGPVPAKSTGHFGLSMEQYAALCAEIAVFPRTGEAIFAKYGLASLKDRMTADLGWQERLRADAALMARWQSLYLHYHEWYSRQGAR
jgi:hypothetical protein